MKIDLLPSVKLFLDEQNWEGSIEKSIINWLTNTYRLRVMVGYHCSDEEAKQTLKLLQEKWVAGLGYLTAIGIG